MSPRPDLARELRAARPTAPPELRERVRLVAAQAPPPRRVLTWRRALVVLVPVAIAGALAAALVPRGHTPAAVSEDLAGRTSAPAQAPAAPAEKYATPAPGADTAAGRASELTPTAPPPDTGRAQRYSATLELRLANANAVSRTTTRALTVVSSLGGYPVTVEVDARAESGTAHLVLRVPRSRVHEAVRRLGALGTIVAENVSIQDLQVGVDAGDRALARLRARRAALRAQEQTPEVTRKVAALTAQIDRRVRARAATLRAAQLATVELRLATPPAPAAGDGGDGALHGLGVIFRWLGVGAVYALALGAPAVALLAVAILLARRIRRGREDRLLSRP